MKKIKKLSLNKEVVSILAGNEMNLVKGGVNVYSNQGFSIADAHLVAVIGGNPPDTGAPASCCQSYCYVCC